jgi:hypothetical protein
MYNVLARQVTPDEICKEYAQFSISAYSPNGIQNDMGNLFLLDKKLPVYGCGLIEGKKLLFAIGDIGKRVVFSSTVRYTDGRVFTVFEE